MKPKIEKALSDYWKSSESEKIAKDVVIVSACRTAIGAFGGSLRDTHAALIGNIAMQAAIKRAGIDPQIIDDVRFGCCMEPADACNAARVSALLAGIPEGTPAVTINRVCISCPKPAR
jgi:acetyl-CoA C-acetyltransferase